MRRGVLVAAALAVAPVVNVIPQPVGAAAAGACVPPVTLSGGSSTQLGPGVSATTYAASSGAGKVTLHLVRADLGRAHAQLLGDGATGTETTAVLARRAPQALAVVNGDLFHIAADDATPTADGLIVSGGAIVKAGAGEADALAVTGTSAGLISPRLVGTATLTDESRIPRPAANAGKSQTAKKKAAARKASAKKKAPAKKPAKRPKRRPPHKVAHPTKPKPAPLRVTLTSVEGSAHVLSTATVGLDGINDLDGGTSAVELTPGWGTSPPSSLLDPRSTEYVLAGTVVVATHPGSQAVRPPAGERALVLGPATAARVPWLGLGDSVALTATLGVPTPDVALGGNAVLVRGGQVDPGCALTGDTTRRPRVAIGAAGGGGTLVLAVAEGDDTSMPGLTLAEFGAALHAAGVADALNLDGGQSSALMERGADHQLDDVSTGGDYSDRPIVDAIAVSSG